MDLVYIWHDAKGIFRSRVRRTHASISSFHSTGKLHINIPTWSYDGSSTGQASTEHSEVLLEPCKYYLDEEGQRVYVLCSTFTIDHTPTDSNHWYTLRLSERPLEEMGMKIGFEQEFFVFDTKTQKHLYAANYSNETIEKGPYYCCVGNTNITIQNRKLEDMIREVYERACSLGVKCTGYNLEVAPSQAEIQLCNSAVEACHDLLFLRYLLWDILGKYGCYPVFDPKPLGEEWNGSGLHTNVSTIYTQTAGGYEVIKNILSRLEKNHKEHLTLFGNGNEKRLTGTHATSNKDIFTWGVGIRSVSVRISYETEKNGRGYFEDRRPAANADPYLVCSCILSCIRDTCA